MKKSIAITACVALPAFAFLLGAGLAGDQKSVKKSTYVDTVYGFSFGVPKFPKTQPGSTIVPVVFSGVGGSGFASSVSVNVNQAVFTRDRYRELSIGEFQRAKLVIDSEKLLEVSGRPAIVWEYEGTVASRNAAGNPTKIRLHSLALAVIDRDRVVLVTCAAQEDAFREIEAEFRACLAGFKLD